MTTLTNLTLYAFKEVEAKGQTDRLTQSQLSALVNKPSLTTLTQRHTPEGCLAFWMTELELKDVEFEDGDVIMLRTKGDGPFIGTFELQIFYF